MTVFIRLISPVVFLSFLLQRCKDSPEVISQKAIIKLDFAHALKPTFYSMQFGTRDTVYINDGFPSQLSISFNAILTSQDRSKLDSLINNMNLSALDTSYDYGTTDGDEFDLRISKNDTLKIIHIRGSSVPPELTGLIDYVIELKQKLKPLSRGERN